MRDYLFGASCAVMAAMALLAGYILIPAFKPRFDPERVTCFPMPSTAGLLRVDQQMGTQKPTAAEKVQAERRVMATYISSVQEAEKNCTTHACEAEELKKYRTAVSFYLHVRENISRNMFRESGEDGLSLASEIFETSADENVIETLQSMHNAGVIDLEALGSAKETAALLVLKPMDAYRPCADETPKASE